MAQPCCGHGLRVSAPHHRTTQIVLFRTLLHETRNRLPPPESGRQTSLPAVTPNNSPVVERLLQPLAHRPIVRIMTTASSAPCTVRPRSDRRDALLARAQSPLSARAHSPHSARAHSPHSERARSPQFAYPDAPRAQRENDGVNPVAGTRFHEDAAHVRLHRRHRDEQFLRNLRVSPPERDEPQNLLLTVRQRIGKVVTRLRRAGGSFRRAVSDASIGRTCAMSLAADRADKAESPAATSRMAASSSSGAASEQESGRPGGNGW